MNMCALRAHLLIHPLPPVRRDPVRNLVPDRDPNPLVPLEDDAARAVTVCLEETAKDEVLAGLKGEEGFPVLRARDEGKGVGG
jgi:hypothetical protein